MDSDQNIITGNSQSPLPGQWQNWDFTRSWGARTRSGSDASVSYLASLLLLQGDTVVLCHHGWSYSCFDQWKNHHPLKISEAVKQGKMTNFRGILDINISRKLIKLTPWVVASSAAYLWHVPLCIVQNFLSWMSQLWGLIPSWGWRSGQHSGQ